MEQGTDKWLEWRKGGIGSSDAPVIMGVSPWSTPFELWEIKTGRVKKNFSNWATERGTTLEPKARAHYEFMTDIDMTPALIEWEKYPFLKASLDGYNSTVNRILEIKCPGAKDHDTAVKGKVPDKYLPQIHHQLMVTAAKQCDYFSFDGEKGVIVTVFPDLEYCAKLLDAELKFWECVVKDKAPPMTDEDYHNIRSVEFKELAKRWIELDFQEVELCAEKAEIREKMLALVPHRRAVGYGIQIVRSTRKGNVDYAKIPGFKDLDLEKYRKPSTEVATISVKKEEETK